MLILVGAISKSALAPFHFWLPGAMAAPTPVSAYLHAAAMVKAGSADPAKYLPVLAKTEGYKGVTGTISFDEKGDVKSGALTLYTYKGEKREQMAVVR